MSGSESNPLLRSGGMVAAILLVVSAAFGCTPPDDEGDAGSEPDGDAVSDTRPQSDVSTDTYAWDTVGRDGGSDSGASGDVGADVVPDAAPVPNQCSEDYRKLINATGPMPRVERIPWKMLAGGTPSYRKKTVTATWKGLKSLQNPVAFDCPPTAGELGLNCRTGQGLVFETGKGSYGRTLVFAVSVPLRTIAFPQKGARVDITYVSGDRHEMLEIRTARDGRRVLVIRAARSDRPDSKRSNPQRFVNDYGEFRVAMGADIEVRESAFCLALDHCDRLLRVEPLHLFASEDSRVSPGEIGDFQADDWTYRFWHLVSYRRNQNLGPESSCGDVTLPASAYAFVRRRPE